SLLVHSTHIAREVPPAVRRELLRAPGRVILVATEPGQRTLREVDRNATDFSDRGRFFAVPLEDSGCPSGHRMAHGAGPEGPARGRVMMGINEHSRLSLAIVVVDVNP